MEGGMEAPRKFVFKGLTQISPVQMNFLELRQVPEIDVLNEAA